MKGVAMAKDTDYLNELYWELLRRTPEYRNFYDKNRSHKYLTKEQQEFLEERGLYKPSPSLFGKYWNLNPDIVAGFMATKEFGVYFTKHDTVFNSRNPQKLFSESAPIVSPDISYFQTPYKITFLLPPDVEVIACQELGTPPTGESSLDRFIRASITKSECIIRVSINRPVVPLVKEFDKTVRGIKNMLKKEGKLASQEKPLFGKFFNSPLRRLRPDTFRKYLKWYDIHMDQKFSFRCIALGEKGKKNIEDVGAELQKIRHQLDDQEWKTYRRKKTEIGDIIGEDAVEKGVKVIYHAIHRKPYKERDVGQIEEYVCIDHMNDCPINCSNLKKWQKKFNSALYRKY